MSGIGGNSDGVRRLATALVRIEVIPPSYSINVQEYNHLIAWLNTINMQYKFDFYVNNF